MKTKTNKKVDMKNLKYILCMAATVAAKADNAALLIGSPETVKEVLSQHLGGFQVSETGWEETKRSGSTNPVTDVFYNIPLTNSKLSSTGIELKQSGRYYIANNFTKALNTAASYVTISGNNIVLDMNSCTIQGDLQAAGANIGIKVSATSNIRLINGAVTGVLGTGISVTGAVDTLSLEKIKVAKYKNTGISIASGSKNLYMSDVNVTTSVSATGAAYGLQLAGTTTGVVENSSFNNNTATGAANSAGVYLSGACNDVTFKNVEANENTGTSTSDHAGFNIGAACSGLKFVNCTANNNGSSGAGRGFGFLNAASAILTDSKFEGCEASSNSCGAYASAALACAGFGILSASTNNTFVNCTASGNTSSTDTAGAIVSGFALALTGADNNRFDGCLSAANSITGTTNGTICAGFYSTQNDNLRFDSCKALGNTNGAAAGITCGFQLTGNGSDTGGVSNVINACEASGQYTSVAAFTGRVVGIELGDYEKLSTVSNCTVVGNAYTGAVAATAGTGSIYGILLGTTTAGVDKCTVMKNTVRSTAITLYTTNTALTLAGIRDFKTDSTSLIAGNVLALNGFARLNIGSAPNYDIAASDLLANATTGGLNIYLTYNDGQNVADIVVETDVSNMQALSTGLEGWTNYLIVPQQA